MGVSVDLARELARRLGEAVDISYSAAYVVIEGANQANQANQAVGTPKDRDAGAAYLREFVEEMKATGFVAQALRRHKIEGAVVAPLSP